MQGGLRGRGQLLQRLGDEWRVHKEPIVHAVLMSESLQCLHAVSQTVARGVASAYSPNCSKCDHVEL